MSKVRHVISDVELLYVLESKMPEFRVLHSSIDSAAFMPNQWNKEDLVKWDKEITRGLKKAKKRVIEGFLAFATSRLKATKLDDCIFDTEPDVQNLLEVGWGLHMFSLLMNDTFNNYNLPFQVLCSRVAGKAPAAIVLHDLHAAFGGFTQSRIRLEKKLEIIVETTSLLSEGYAWVEKLHEATLEAVAACTDARDAFMILKDAHQTTYERVKARC